MVNHIISLYLDFSVGLSIRVNIESLLAYVLVDACLSSYWNQ